MPVTNTPASTPDEHERRAIVRALQAAASAAGSSIYLGRGAGGWAWAGPERATLVLGPSRSGKTTCLVVPNVLAAPGAVVSTSTKGDVMEATAASRARVGCPMLYDPTGTFEGHRDVERVGWSPVNAAIEWDGAQDVADAMVRSSEGGSLGRDPHWPERATALLGPLLHAAALCEEQMSTVLNWVDRHQGEPALEVLDDRLGEDHPATAVLTGILATDPREQSGIWSTASGALTAFRSEAAISSTRGPFLDAEDFCEHPHTLYVCAPSRKQQLTAPLIVGLLSEIRDAAYRRGASRPSPPVLFALDEVANIAPLPDLPSIVTEGAGQGLLTLACLQDLSQARHRWGKEAEAFLSIFGCTAVLGGIADMTTLEALSALAGEREMVTRTVGRSRASGAWSRPSISDATVFRPRLSRDQVARGAPGRALCLNAANRLGWVELTPSHLSEPWRRAIEPPTRHRPPPGPALQLDLSD